MVKRDGDIQWTRLIQQAISWELIFLYLTIAPDSRLRIGFHSQLLSEGLKVYAKFVSFASDVGMVITNKSIQDG